MPDGTAVQPQKPTASPYAGQPSTDPQHGYLVAPSSGAMPDELKSLMDTASLPVMREQKAPEE